jgi:hypothetical protein
VGHGKYPLPLVDPEKLLPLTSVDPYAIGGLWLSNVHATSCIAATLLDIDPTMMLLAVFLHGVNLLAYITTILLILRWRNTS